MRLNVYYSIDNRLQTIWIYNEDTNKVELFNSEKEFKQLLQKVGANDKSAVTFLDNARYGIKKGLEIFKTPEELAKFIRGQINIVGEDAKELDEHRIEIDLALFDYLDWCILTGREIPKTLTFDYDTMFRKYTKEELEGFVEDIKKQHNDKTEFAMELDDDLYGLYDVTYGIDLDTADLVSIINEINQFNVDNTK